MRVVLDSNVFISLFDPRDRHHPECRFLLDSIHGEEIKVVCPIIVLAETVCALQRRIGDTEFSIYVLENLKKLESILWLENTMESIEAAIRFGVQTGLKGADAIVAETARSMKLPLVTQDREIQSKCTALMEVMPPSELALDH